MSENLRIRGSFNQLQRLEHLLHCRDIALCRKQDLLAQDGLNGWHSDHLAALSHRNCPEELLSDQLLGASGFGIAATTRGISRLALLELAVFRRPPITDLIVSL